MMARSSGVPSSTWLSRPTAAVYARSANGALHAIAFSYKLLAL
jgi:hypothetical protein